jgi:hypothetical protein
MKSVQTQIRIHIHKQLLILASDQLRNQVSIRVNIQIWGQVYDQVYDQVSNRLLNNMSKHNISI